MSARPGTFAYAQARLQARLGARGATASVLQRAHATRDLGALLQLLRTTSLGPHIARIAPDLGVHEIERRLRDDWARTVDEVARWQPAQWRAAVHWLRWLPYLPALQKLARVGRAPAWMREDPWLARIVAVDPPQRRAALVATPLAPLGAGFDDEGDVVGQWLAHWRTLWPASEHARHGLAAVVRVLAAHVSGLHNVAPSAASEPLLGVLATQLQRLFRRHPLTPTAAIAWLGLEAIDLLALRGLVTARAALDGVTAT